MTSALDITQAVKPPRSVFLDFPLGHQTGKALQPELQQNILVDAFNALESMEEPGAIVTLPYRWNEAGEGWKDAEYRPGYLAPYSREPSLTPATPPGP